MVQKQFREYLLKVYTPQEADAIINELFDRTDSEHEGYNSINELAIKLMALELSNITGVQLYEDLDDNSNGKTFLPPIGSANVSYKVVNITNPSTIRKNGYYYWDGAAYVYHDFLDVEAVKALLLSNNKHTTRAAAMLVVPLPDDGALFIVNNEGEYNGVYEYDSATTLGYREVVNVKSYINTHSIARIKLQDALFTPVISISEHQLLADNTTVFNSENTIGVSEYYDTQEGDEWNYLGRFGNGTAAAVFVNEAGDVLQAVTSTDIVIYNELNPLVTPKAPQGAAKVRFCSNNSSLFIQLNDVSLTKAKEYTDEREVVTKEYVDSKITKYELDSVYKQFDTIDEVVTFWDNLSPVDKIFWNRTLFYIAKSSANAGTYKFVNNPVGKNLFNPNDPLVFKGGYIDATGKELPNSQYIRSGYIPTVEGETFTCNFPLKGAAIVFYDGDKNVVKGVTDSSTQTTPSRAYFFRVSGSFTNKYEAQVEYGIESTEFEEYGEAPNYVSVNDESEDSDEFNPLKDAVLIMDGDSMSGNDPSYVMADTTFYQIADENGMDFQHIGVGGTTTASVDNGEGGVVGNDFPLVDRIRANIVALKASEGYNSVTKGYYICHTSTNDNLLETPVGSDVLTEVSNATVMGAMKTIIDIVRNELPNFKVGFITPYNNNAISVDYIEAMVAIGKLKAVPVFNSMSQSGIDMQNSDHLSMFTVDHLHLNLRGMAFVKSCYYSFIKSL